MRGNTLFQKLSDKQFKKLTKRLRRWNRRLYDENFEKMEKYWFKHVRDIKGGEYDMFKNFIGTPTLKHRSKDPEFKLLIGREKYLQTYDMVLKYATKIGLYWFRKRNKKKVKILFDR